MNVNNATDPLNTISVRMSYGSEELETSYGNGAFYCPRAPGPLFYFQGNYYLQCDLNGLSGLTTDGFSTVNLKQWHYCDAAPINGHYAYYTIDTQANGIDISSLVTCTTEGNFRTCTQPTTGPLAQFEVPVIAYTLGGTMGYLTIDQNGVYVPESVCPQLVGGNPMVIEMDGCVHGRGSV